MAHIKQGLDDAEAIDRVSSRLLEPVDAFQQRNPQVLVHEAAHEQSAAVDPMRAVQQDVLIGMVAHELVHHFVNGFDFLDRRENLEILLFFF